MAQPGPGVRPHLVVSSVSAFVDFVVAAFGAKEVHERVSMPGDPRVMHTEVEIGGSLFYLSDDFPEFTGGKHRNPKAVGSVPMVLHHSVENCDAAVERAVAAGAKVLMPPQDQFWGDRYALVEDPCGYQWSFGQKLSSPPPPAPWAGA
ncbi:MAG: VOC family protein [Phycisphaerales bacterium]